MFRKIASCAFALAIAAMAAPASAIRRGTYEPPDPPIDNVIMKVDIDAYGNTGPNETQVGWTAWEMSDYWVPIGAQSKNFGYAGLPLVTIDGITVAGCSTLGGSRDRVDGVEGEMDSDLANVLADFVYLHHTHSGMGRDYIKLTFNFGPGRANYNYDITLWGWDPAIKGSGLPEFGGAGEPPDSKWAAWSTTNPDQWLTDNGYDPNGYGYSSTVGESNMPAGLKALVGDMAPMHGTAPWLTVFDAAVGMTYASTVNVTLNEYGVVTLYGWLDMTSELGSQHLVLNGFAVTVPEPATVFLVGFGGLLLKRARKSGQ